MTTSIDWQTVATIAAPIVALFAGAALDRWYEGRQRLVVYLTNMADFVIRLTGPPAQDMHCRTFSLVLRNAGTRATENVRIGHHWLPPNVAINPSIPHQIDHSPPETAAEVQIDRMVPAQQVTISYLVWGDVQATNVISYVNSDDGEARVLNVLPTPQLPRWLLRLLRFLIVVGVVTVLYLAYLAVNYLITGQGA